MRKIIIRKSKELTYEVSGDGGAVFLIHGFGEDRSIWDSIVTILSQDYKVFTIDLPGTGDSEFAGEESIDDLSGVIESVMNEEGLNKIVLGGHSMGGYISMAFAKHFPGKLKALMMIHSSAFADDEEKKKAREKSIAFIRENGSNAFLKNTISGLFFNPDTHKAAIEKLVSENRCTPETLISYYTAMMNRPDNSPVLETVNCPVLFIAGEHDKAVPLTATLKQSHLPRVSKIKILPNSAHMGMIEEKETVEETLAKFLQGVFNGMYAEG